APRPDRPGDRPPVRGRTARRAHRATLLCALTLSSSVRFRALAKKASSSSVFSAKAARISRISSHFSARSKRLSAAAIRTTNSLGDIGYLTLQHPANHLTKNHTPIFLRSVVSTGARECAAADGTIDLL